jgi:hypothetical protein
MKVPLPTDFVSNTPTILSKPPSRRCLMMK